jgi:hypothetical protein
VNDDLAAMDDVTFLAEKRRVREAIATTPAGQVTAEQRDQLDRVNAEFLHRAGLAWQDACTG